MIVEEVDSKHAYDAERLQHNETFKDDTCEKRILQNVSISHRRY